MKQITATCNINLWWSLHVLETYALLPAFRTSHTVHFPFRSFDLSLFLEDEDEEDVSLAAPSSLEDPVAAAGVGEVDFSEPVEVAPSSSPSLVDAVVPPEELIAGSTAVSCW